MKHFNLAGPLAEVACMPERAFCDKERSLAHLSFYSQRNPSDSFQYLCQSAVWLAVDIKTWVSLITSIAIRVSCRVALGSDFRFFLSESQLDDSQINYNLKNHNLSLIVIHFHLKRSRLSRIKTCPGSSLPQDGWATVSITQHGMTKELVVGISIASSGISIASSGSHV